MTIRAAPWLLSRTHSIMTTPNTLRLCALIIIGFLFKSTKSEGEVPAFTVIEGDINGILRDKIDGTVQKMFYYKLNESMISNLANTNIRVWAEVSKLAGRSCPILFSVQESQSVLSWDLPAVHTANNGSLSYYYTAGRTLCIDSARESLEQTIIVSVSTCNIEPVEFSLSLGISDDFLIFADAPSTEVTISPTEPIYYRFDYETVDAQTNHVMITLSSLNVDNICMTFSIQDPTCPVFDEAANIQFQGYWQTLNSQASITIRRKHYPNGFFLVFVVLSDDEPCTERSGIFEDIRRSAGTFAESRTKTFSFSVYGVIEPSEYVAPTLVPLALIFGIQIVVFIVFAVFQNALLRLEEPTGDRQAELQSRQGMTANFQSCLCLDDLKERNLEVLQKQSNRYYWTVVTIGIFYCVPVFQLITNYLQVLYRTGDYDLCYYNYMCARPLGYLVDFNHIYSNVGYVLFGIVFIIFVLMRQMSLNTNLLADSDGDSAAKDDVSENSRWFRKIFPKIIASRAEYGTLQHFGLYYALGVALILEGLLSSAYHICPNQSNFQFDTSFMYVIAVLGIVKVYQFRHPVYLSANITFISLAFVAASSVFGLLFNNLIFKICFSVIHFLGIISVLLYLYHIGFYTEDGTVVTGWVDIYRGVLGVSKSLEKTREASSRKGRLILPVLALLLNISLITMIWTIMRDSNFATQLLAIFVANFAVYTFYYVIMKLLHSEYKSKVWIVQFVIYGVLGGGLWILSLNYFQQAQSSWEASPAESRALNDKCIVYDFYDNHDMWHFTSSAALFCSYMLLLTIDDDLLTTRHENIPVF